MPKNEDFSKTFAALRAILLAHKDQLSITQDRQDHFSTDALRVRYRGKPVMFGAVRTGKNYVSFHFMPVYMNPQLQKRISPELRQRMQGKACFNFKTPDEELFRQLAELTAAGLRSFAENSAGWPGIEIAETPRP